MTKRLLTLIGRTYIAAFLIVNLFNIIPFNFAKNSWYVAVSMLFVDTASLALIGFAALKFASFISIRKDSENLTNNNDVNESQKYKNNLKAINRYSRYFMFLYVFIALFQIFVIVNGSKQLDLLSSVSINNLEKIYQKDIAEKFPNDVDEINNKNKTLSTINDVQEKKEELLKRIMLNKNSAMSYLFKDATKIFLMSTIWAYGFFKLEKF